MRSSARIAAALVSTAFAVSATATGAFAQSTTVKDKASDVIAYADDNDQNGTVLGYAESIASGADLRSVTVDHGKTNVTLTIKFADLQNTTAVSVAFRPDAKKRPNRVLANTGRASGVVFDTDGEARCTVKLKTRPGRSGSIKATVKRSCLGSPDKIRVSVAAVSLGDDGRLRVDSLSKGDPRRPVYTKALKAS
ncbi:hypothetical protein [Aeromicrobium fastidiosum]|uniref:Tat pathway signal sequence domain protein n=1 Tax=Aeromicrobium fastidiosum TaxID=52699 RepID=A0A641APA7_9ACTN|nr:hypothetical protein [Aeromicrobium fastidiosum]KAA1378706.1 hypothetical protein ESP62_010245 [Aeromicrobium fastidiosum]MBP2392306.1 hypothetical protein [Aeromicrobium fastidiosum]